MDCHYQLTTVISLSAFLDQYGGGKESMISLTRPLRVPATHGLSLSAYVGEGEHDFLAAHGLSLSAYVGEREHDS